MQDAERQGHTHVWHRAGGADGKGAWELRPPFARPAEDPHNAAEPGGAHYCATAQFD